MKTVEAIRQDARERGLAGLEAELLLAHVLGVSRERLIAYPEREVSTAEAEALGELMSQLKAGRPLAYLHNRRSFYGRNFYVDENVLIPRPETELLVEMALEYAESESAPTICDIGTGSGCIAISLALGLPDAQITALEISPGALKVAQRNARTHGVESRINFIESDLLSALHEPAFTGIVANLPYIAELAPGGEPEAAPSYIERGVLNSEPHSALFGGVDGLELYGRLLEEIKGLSHKPRWLIVEVGFDQKEAFTALLEKHFAQTPIIWKNDLAGIPRICIAELN